jgi:hypothetical protein
MDQESFANPNLVPTDSPSAGQITVPRWAVEYAAQQNSPQDTPPPPVGQIKADNSTLLSSDAYQNYVDQMHARGRMIDYMGDMYSRSNQGDWYPGYGPGHGYYYPVRNMGGRGNSAPIVPYPQQTPYNWNSRQYNSNNPNNDFPGQNGGNAYNNNGNPFYNLNNLNQNNNGNPFYNSFNNPNQYNNGTQFNNFNNPNQYNNNGNPFYNLNNPNQYNTANPFYNSFNNPNQYNNNGNPFYNLNNPNQYNTANPFYNLNNPNQYNTANQFYNTFNNPNQYNTANQFYNTFNNPNQYNNNGNPFYNTFNNPNQYSTNNNIYYSWNGQYPQTSAQSNQYTDANGNQIVGMSMRIGPGGQPYTYNYVTGEQAPWQPVETQNHRPSHNRDQVAPTTSQMGVNEGGPVSAATVEHWQRSSQVINSMVGHSIQDYDKSIPERLGCARFVSLVLHKADGLPIYDIGVENLESSLRRHGFKQLPISKAKPGDVIIAHRYGNDYGHAAIYVGNGQVANNSSKQRRIAIDSATKFNSPEYQSVCVYRKV